MQIISTTQLRTKSKELLKVLSEGGSVDLVHRSKIVGQILPKSQNLKIFDKNKFLKLVKKINLPKLTDKEIEKRYKETVLQKYGKSLSRRKQGF